MTLAAGNSTVIMGSVCSTASATTSDRGFADVAEAATTEAAMKAASAVVVGSLARVSSSVEILDN